MIRSLQRNAHPHFHPSVSISSSSCGITQRRWPIASCGWHGPELLVFPVESAHYHQGAKSMTSRSSRSAYMVTFLCKVNCVFCGRGVTRPVQRCVLPPSLVACFSCLCYNKIAGMNLRSGSLHGLCWGAVGHCHCREQNTGGFLKTEQNNHIPVMTDSKMPKWKAVW